MGKHSRIISIYLPFHVECFNSTTMDENISSMLHYAIPGF